MTAIKAVVFDANVFGKDAIPSVPVIESWAGACESHRAELWVPEVVVAELAEHALKALSDKESVLQSYGALRRRLGLSGVAVPLATTYEDIRNAIEDAGAQIIELDGDSAREAILDQALLSGPAERKAASRLEAPTALGSDLL